MYWLHTLSIHTFLSAVLSWLLKCKFLHHRLKVVTAMFKFHPRWGTHKLIWDKGFTSCEREQEKGRKWCIFSYMMSNPTAEEMQCRALRFSGFTDVVGEYDTGLPVAEFHSQLSASLHSHPCTHTLSSQSLHRHQLRPSVCTLCHSHLTTDNWCHPVRKHSHQCVCQGLTLVALYQ